MSVREALLQHVGEPRLGDGDRRVRGLHPEPPLVAELDGVAHARRDLVEIARRRRAGQLHVLRLQREGRVRPEPGGEALGARHVHAVPGRLDGEVARQKAIDGALEGERRRQRGSLRHRRRGHDRQESRERQPAAASPSHCAREVGERHALVELGVLDVELDRVAAAARHGDFRHVDAGHPGHLRLRDRVRPAAGRAHGQRHLRLLHRRAVGEVGEMDQEPARLARGERVVLEEVLDAVRELRARESRGLAGALRRPRRPAPRSQGERGAREREDPPTTGGSRCEPN